MNKKKIDDLDLNDLEMLDPNYLEKELNKKIENSEYVKKSTSQGLISLAKNHALANGAIDWIKTLYKNHAGKMVLNEKDLVVWLLFGKFVSQYEKLITNKRHLILKTPHPSTFSARKGFFGSKIFSKTNEYLSMNNLIRCLI